MKHLPYIRFNSKELQDLVLNSVLEEFVANGGSELARYCLNYENSLISFSTNRSLNVFNLLSIANFMRAEEIETFSLSSEHHTIEGYSGDGGKEWVFAVMSNSDEITGVLEKLWYSVFEL